MPSAIAEPLAERAQAIAKGWLLLLLERAPLDAVGAIPAAALAAEAPAICAAFARALGSDAELARLASSGELAPLAGRIAALAGATDAASTVAAVDALRACVWAAALDGHGARADADVVSALAERLAAVAAEITATALGGSGLPAVASSPAHEAQPVAGASAAAGEPAPPAAGGADPTTVEPAPPAAELPVAGSPAVHDLRDGADGVPASSPDPVATLPVRPAADPRAGPASAMEDSDLWITTLERHIDRCQREGGGLALLRVELVDGDRLVAGASPDERGVPYGRLAQAIRRAIRRQDLVAADRHGRAWVIAPAVGRAGAIALAERIGVGVERGEHWRGAPLAATIGFAVYGEDGRDAATLIDRAEEAMLAASAAGVRIGESVPFDDAGPDRPGPRLVR